MGDKKKEIKLEVLGLEERLGYEKAQETLNIIIRILNNLIQNPNEPKWRKVPLTNAKIKQSLLETDGWRIMAIAGFELVDDFLQLPLAIAAESLAQYATYLSLLITTQNARKVKQQQKKDLLLKQQLLEKSQKNQQEREVVQEGRGGCDSVARQLPFGSSLKTFRDIGVDLNRKRG